MHAEQDKYNKNICFLLTLVLMLPLLTNFFGAILNQMIGKTTYTTYAIYAVVLFYFVRKYRLQGQKNLYLFIILTSLTIAAVLINRVLFPDTIIYFNSNKNYLYIMFIFYYPIAYAMAFVDDWSHFFKYMRFSAFWTPFLCWFAMKVFALDEIIDYMQFSNILLPGFLAGWYVARVQKKRMYYIPCFFSLYLQIFYGSRMSFASALIFIVLLEIIQLGKDTQGKSIVKVSLLTIATVVGYIYFENIVRWFLECLQSIGFENSRTVQSILEGTVFESTGRNWIYENAKYELRHLGLGMYGFFGDRVIFEKYGGVIYVHNIFYELILSFGWILGGGASVWLVFIQVKEFFFKKNMMKRVMLAYFICLIFFRLLVSGSFIIEGQFLLLIGALMNRNVESKEREEIDEEMYLLENEELASE